MMDQKAFQDFYPDDLAHCYGCGRLNEKGLKIKSFWDGQEAVCEYMPRDYHIAIPGFVYGGLISSLIDCHSTGTAAAAKYQEEGRPMDSVPALRFVTASLHVDYLNPTPLHKKLLLRSKIKEIKGRKVSVSTVLTVEGKVCAKGEVIAVQIPENKFRAAP